MSNALQSLYKIANTSLFEIGNTGISLTTLVTVLSIMTMTIWLSRVLRRLVSGVFSRNGTKPGVIGTTTALIHYSTLFCGFGIALSTAGIDLTALFATGAVFAVAFGFAMQSIAQNFVSGLILLTERAIKPGDVIQIEGRILRVSDVGIRASVAQGLDGEEFIVPNSLLIQNTVQNLTLKDEHHRVGISVGLSYETDMQKARAVLQRQAEQLNEIKTRKPLVILDDFADSSVVWSLHFWISDPWTVRERLSEAREGVWFALKKDGITIAYPQLDLHVKDVQEGIRFKDCVGLPGSVN